MSEKQRKRSIFNTSNEYIEEVEKLEDELQAPAMMEGPSWNTEAFCLHALSNVLITSREVVVTADLPNIEPESVKVEVRNEDYIDITAKMKKKVRFEEWGIYHRQGEFSSLRCQGRIPVSVDASQMKISLKGGILEVRFPRKEKYEIE